MCICPLPKFLALVFRSRSTDTRGKEPTVLSLRGEDLSFFSGQAYGDGATGQTMHCSGVEDGGGGAAILAGAAIVAATAAFATVGGDSGGDCGGGGGCSGGGGDGAGGA
ncbi:hypothetical protein U1Q18_000870 [Sarracenia purpurea var. burkii]